MGTLPAERTRGLIWSQDFRSAADVVRAGGAISGAPVFHPQSGVHLDGTADEIVFPSDALQPVRSVVLDVTLDTTTEDALNLSATHSISVAGGTLTATGFAAPTYYIGGVATQTIGTTRAVVAITTATGIDVDDLRVGFVTAFGALAVHSIRLFSTELTDQEALDYSQGAGCWTGYYDEMLGFYPLGLENDNPTYSTGLTSMGNLLKGDGSTSTLFPAKLAGGPGYVTDSNDYMRVPAGFYAGTPPGLTIWAVVEIRNPAVGCFLSCSEGLANFNLLLYYWDTEFVIFNQYYSTTALNRTSVTAPYGNGKRTVVVVTTDNVESYVYADGVKSPTCPRVDPLRAMDAMMFTLFARAATTVVHSKSGTRIYAAGIDDKAWTPLQVLDFTQRMKRWGALS